jgi:hypothetical protein
MPHEHLERPAIDTRCEQVGRTTVAQRRHTRAVRAPRALLRMIVDFLRRADGPRRLGIASRQQPGGWSVEAPVGAQLGQQTGGEPRLALLAAFPLRDAEQHALTFHSRELPPHDFTNAQACGIRGHQADTVPGILRLCDQALEFLEAQDLRER